MSYTNYKIDELAQDFSEDAWNAFHNAEINDQDDLYDYRQQWIDNNDGSFSLVKSNDV